MKRPSPKHRWAVVAGLLHAVCWLRDDGTLVYMSPPFAGRACLTLDPVAWFVPGDVVSFGDTAHFHLGFGGEMVQFQSEALCRDYGRAFALRHGLEWSGEDEIYD